MTYPFLSRRLGSGNEIRGQAGENLGDRKVVYLDGNGRWRLADADTAARMPTVGFTIGLIASGNWGRILLQGLVGRAGWTWTRGGDLYASTVAGEITHTAPIAPDLVQRVGVAYEVDVIYFNPTGNLASLSILDYEVQTGIIAEPTTASKGNGHAVVVHNETEERDFLWVRTDLNTKWMGCEFI